MGGPVRYVPILLVSAMAALLIGQRHLADGVVVLRDNGYEGVTVAIHRNVPEDPRIVDNIKSLLTSASRALYSATRRRAFFRHVTVVVPASWSRVHHQRHRHVDTAGGVVAAEVRVDRANPAYGNNPYTEQPGGCGEPGNFIHLTADFVAELHGETTEEYGDPGKTFVHEWAHLRYGVFDEYGDWNSEFPPYYIDSDGQVHVTGCQSNETNSPRPSNGGATCTDPQDCVFDLDLDIGEDNGEEEGSKSSLMYLHFLPGADGFCGSDPSRPHNAEAPNRQNMVCQGRSSWDVISAHPDFADGNNPSGPIDVDTTPNFRIAQLRNEDRGTFVLLLDVSGSMNGHRMAMLHRAASRFVLDQIPEQARLGVVAFSSEARVLLNMTVVTDADRERIVKALPTSDDGGRTAIGMALGTALQILNMSQGEDTSATSAGSGVIILISDGEENVSPYVKSQVPLAAAAGAVVNTVAFGRSASSQLESLVSATGGRGFFYPDDNDWRPEVNGTTTALNGNQQLESAFLAAMSTQADIDFMPVEIMNTLEIVSPDQTTSNHVFIDEEVRRNTKFLFGYTSGDHLTVKVEGPGGNVYGEGSPEFEKDVVGKVIRFVFPETEAGKWTYRITNGRLGIKQGVGVMVTSEVVDPREQPVRIESWINVNTVDFPKDIMRSKVFAKVTKSYVAVLDALVVAAVERPLGASVQLLLQDDGVGADSTAADGIYSAFFSQYNGTGRYAVTVSVANDGRAALKLAKDMTELRPPPPSAAVSRSAYGRLMSTAGRRSHRSGHLTAAAGLKMGEFQRTTNAGSFKVEGWIKEEDFVPPRRVIDLRVALEGASDDDASFTLTWTSAGDDFDSGQADRWVVYVQTNVVQLRQDYLDGRSLENMTLESGSHTPVPSGEPQKIAIRIPRLTFQHDIAYFAVQLCDERNNCAETSNIVVLNIHVSETHLNAFNVLIAIGILTIILVLLNWKVFTILVEKNNQEVSV